MPKIIIKEIDSTSPGPREYSNFTVVVPGFVSTGADTSVFDDNGIYECTSQTDFKTHVGQVAAAANPLAAKVPTLVNLGSTEDLVFKRALALAEFVEYAGKIYLWHAEPEEASDGYLSCTTASAEVEGTLCLPGYYTLVATADYDVDETDYCVIEPGNEGRDANLARPQLGNQIAYELLGLGYTVLYKKLDTTTTFGPNNVTGVDALEEAAFWEPLLDKANYDFRFVVNGLLEDNLGANEAISALCSFVNSLPENNGRGDCTALVDIDTKAYKNLTVTTQKEVVQAIILAANTLSKADKYTAIFAPTVIYNRAGDAAYNYNNELPATFHYLACAAEASLTFPEWFAVAGYTRGKNSEYAIAKTSVTLGEVAVNALSPRTQQGGLTHAVNIIAKTRNNYYL